VSRDFDETVAITAIHPELGDVNIVRERHRLDRLVAHFGIFWRDVIPRRDGQSARDQNGGNGHLQRQPVAPAWEKIRHIKLADGLLEPLQRVYESNLARQSKTGY